MSINTDPSLGCKGKKPYRSFVFAELVASRSAKRNGEPMHAYHCKRCNKFHVGTHHVLKRPEPKVEEIEHDD